MANSKLRLVAGFYVSVFKKPTLLLRFSFWFSAHAQSKYPPQELKAMWRFLLVSETTLILPPTTVNTSNLLLKTAFFKIPHSTAKKWENVLCFSI